MRKTYFSMQFIASLAVMHSLAWATDASTKPHAQNGDIIISANSDEDEKDSKGSLTVQSNMKATKEIQQTAGGVAVVDSKDFENKYTLNFQDTLAYIPGVYAQKRFGEEVRISIRGSGLSRGFHLRGLDLLQDGIPFNLADGAADFQEADSLAVQRIEVFKGANALEYGSSTLGGAVNMVSKTGKSTPGDFVRAEGGSFNTYRLNVQSGRDFGDSDAFLSVTGTSSDGFRQHTDQKNIKINSNFGKAISDNAETRFYVSGNIIDQELPGSLSRTDALNSPKKADGLAINDDQKRDIRSLRVSNKTTFKVNDNNKVDIGAFVNLKDLFHPLAFFIGVIDQESIDYGAFIEGSGEYHLSDYRNRYTLGLRSHLGEVNAKRYQNNQGSRGALIGSAVQNSKNVTLYGENHFFILPQFALVTGAQLRHSQRKLDNKINSLASDSQNYNAFNPKIGILFEPNKDMQFFANVSKSHEPPTFSELTQGGVASGFTPVNAQKAWTAEIGTRGIYDIASWDISLYRSWLRDEMLQYTTGSGIPATTFNANNTIHQGIEFGLDLQLAQSIFSNDDNLQLRNAYTFSDYQFDGDTQYGNNNIAGQPKHFFQSEIRYDNSHGWYVAPQIELAGGAEVDFSNTVQTPGYGIVGLNAGYDINPNITLFVDGRNLLNKKYISTFSTTVNGAGNVFYPGDGRAVYSGLRVKL